MSADLRVQRRGMEKRTLQTGKSDQGCPGRGRKAEQTEMAARKSSRPAQTARQSRAARKESTSDPASRQFSAIVGVALIGVAALWFIWLVVRQVNPGIVSLSFPFPNLVPPRSANTPVDPLAAAGITLSAPLQGQEPGLTQQQALLLAAQIEPQVAAKAADVSARYTLFSYQGTAPGAPSFHNIPVWLIHYSGIAEPHPDTGADPHATGAQHDFYVFLDANSGRELLAIWL
jgi:hypothetical protein